MHLLLKIKYSTKEDMSNRTHKTLCKIRMTVIPRAAIQI